MGGYTRSATVFLFVSKGKFVNKQKEISLDGYEGFLIKLTRSTADYQGTAYEEYRLHVRDSAPDSREEATICFRLESWFSASFFSRLPNVDLSKPVLVGVYNDKEVNEKISFCYMRQGGQKIERDKSFPMPNKVIVNKKTVYDYTDVEAVYDAQAVRINEAGAKLGDLPQATGPAPKASEEPPANDVPPPKDDDLPF